jgi:hypothetical protein
MRHDVLIVGAGLTGLVLALWLTKLGTEILIDKMTAPSTASRALMVHARTLELYRQLRLADIVVARGHKVPAVRFWVNGEPQARLSFEEVDADRTPYSLPPHSLLAPADLSSGRASTSDCSSRLWKVSASHSNGIPSSSGTGTRADRSSRDCENLTSRKSFETRPTSWDVTTMYHSTFLHGEPRTRKAGIIRDALYLLRPDTYIGLTDRSGSVGPLRHYLDARGIRTGSAERPGGKLDNVGQRSLRPFDREWQPPSPACDVTVHVGIVRRPSLKR